MLKMPQVILINVQKKLKEMLKVDKIEEVMDVSEKDKEICVVSQIKVKNELIAYFPYVLAGRNVIIYL